MDQQTPLRRALSASFATLATAVVLGSQMLLVTHYSVKAAPLVAQQQALQVAELERLPL